MSRFILVGLARSVLAQREMDPRANWVEQLSPRVRCVFPTAGVKK